MRERSNSTLAGSGAPAGSGEWVSLFVPDEHPVLRLKGALDWAAITAVMVTHWRAAGKNVDGGPGRLSGVGFLSSQTHLRGSSQCVIWKSLGPRFRNEAALRETSLIE